MLPPIPEPPAGAGALVVEVSPYDRLLFDLRGRLPTQDQMVVIRRSIERDQAQRDNPGELVWRWVE